MNKVVCPTSGEECYMAQWTSDHINAQFYIPKDQRQKLCDFVIERVMICGGDQESCEPANPISIDLAVEEFKQQLQEG